MAKLGIVYWSGTGNTEKMAELIAKGAQEAGAEVVCKNVSGASADDLDACDVVALGSPSMGTEVVEESEMQPFIEIVMPKLTAKKTALFGSYGWGDGEWMRTWSSEMKSAGVNLMDDGLIVNETPDGASADECVEYGRKLAAF